MLSPGGTVLPQPHHPSGASRPCRLGGRLGLFRHGVGPGLSASPGLFPQNTASYSHTPGAGWCCFRPQVPVGPSLSPHTAKPHPASSATCSRQNNGPPETHVPRTPEPAPSVAKRDFVDAMKLRVLHWREYPGLSDYPTAGQPPSLPGILVPGAARPGQPPHSFPFTLQHLGW